MRKAALLLVVSLAGFSFPGCQTLSRGRTQPIPATSQPPGVKVLVDGTAIGATPINLKLTRREIHIVRFEMTGYRSVEIHITKKRPPLGETILTSAIWAPIGAVAFGIPIYVLWHSVANGQHADGDFGRGLMSLLMGAVLGWAAGTLIDSSLPSNYDLSPQALFVTMEKADDMDPPVIIETDAAQFQRVRWIRVRPKWGYDTNFRILYQSQIPEKDRGARKFEN